MKLDDQQLLGICLQEIIDSSGYASGDTQDEMAKAMDRYLGAPLGNEVEGRSQVRTREVFETVEGILPNLIRIFAESDNLITFDAIGPEDEEQAEQESDTVNHVYWSQNRGFYNTYTFIKDCLLSKVGIMKVWADISDKEEREEYNGLDEMQLGELLSDEEYERELLEWDMDEMGYNVVFKTKSKRVDIRVEPVAPEDFGVNADARSPYAKDASFVWHRARKTYSDLIAEGYDRKIIETLPHNDAIGTQLNLARRHLSDESELFNYGSDELTMQVFYITECYFRADRDGDDISELLKVTIATGYQSASGGVVLDVEEVDTIPFATTPPNILTHKFTGLSIPDIIMDIEEINTTLFRQVIDNTYLANNGLTAVNTDYVNIDDLMSRRPGGNVRFEGDMPWSNVIGPIPHNQLPPQTFELFERLDERQKRRTGYGDEVGALDASALANVNTGVAAMAFDQARTKLELIARIIAEIGFKPMLHDIHELLLKHQSKVLPMKLNGTWVHVTPSDWKTRENSTVQVGVGRGSHERRIMATEQVMAKQAQLVQQGAMGTLVQPQHIYEAHRRWAKAMGLDAAQFFQDPAQLPPPQPPQPDAQQKLMEAQGQAMLMEGQSKMQRNQIDAQKLQYEQEWRQQDAEMKQAEIMLRAQIERLKGDLTTTKAQMDVNGKVATIQGQREKDQVEVQLKTTQMRLDQLNATKDRELEAYKIQTDWYAKMLALHNLEQDPAKAQAREMAESSAHESKEQDRMLMGELYASLVAMTEKIGNMETANSQPKLVKRDAKGLMIQFGDKPVVRDESGRIAQIG